MLNADDPRVLAMRRHATGRPWLFSTDPNHPAIREALADGGRGMTVLDGRLTWVERHETHPLVPLVDMPVTLAGISRTNLQNAMAAAAAGLAIGLPERAVIRGLEDVRPRPGSQPRTREPLPHRRTHRRDRLRAQRGRDDRPDGGAATGSGARDSEVWLAICTAGDRTDRILHGFAFRAAVGSDHLAIAELIHYLRGRSRDDIIERLREGAREAGVEDVPVYDDELAALRDDDRERVDRRRDRRHRARDATGDLRVARGQRRRTPGSGRRPAAS